MTVRDEQIRLFVNCLNIIAAGVFVGVMLTIPLAVLTTGHISGSDEAVLELVYASVAVILHGCAQFTLWRYG